MSAMDNIRTAIRHDLTEKPDGILEAVAEKHGVPLLTVLECLGENAASPVAGGDFESVWNELTAWGDITFVVHTRDGVFETKGSLPNGETGRGYFNVHGASPISGHIKADRCSLIYLVDRPFFGKRSCSVQFINEDGEAMFKVFVGRNEDRSLKGDQLARFETLRERLMQGAQALG
ncbi:heme utilization cystosolic carrier protein HutX [Microvirga flavescens]|uniref:heme utilization cystosolic carrier protein HutX n=1 Tax=Microvirga flavescens TaxID=2249811 RepID=UPI000DDC2A82|nr:heme utilization cystosolic carrier protein HutX [Microvirga flavescens]